MRGADLRYLVALLPLVAVVACNQIGNGTAVIQVYQGTTEVTSGGSYDFGGTAIGSSSVPVTFTIKNTGTASASLKESGALTITGSNAADFAVSTQPDLTIAAGASTTFALVFSPSAVSAESVQIALSSAVGTYSFTLAGTGTYSGTLQMFYNSGTGWQSLSNSGTASFPYLYGPGQHEPDL